MFIDSVVWIGAKLERDQWHAESKSVLQRFLNHDIRIAYVTDYVVLESVNFILRKAGFDAALETLNLFRAHGRIKIVNVDAEMFDEICRIFAEYPGLSILGKSPVVMLGEH